MGERGVDFAGMARLPVRGTRRGDAGLTTTELAVLFPVIIAIVLAVVQVTLWAHAGAVAQAAADYGAEVAAAYGSDSRAGEHAARAYLDQIPAVSNASAQSLDPPDSDTVTITVRAEYPSVFGMLGISATATTVRERLPG